MTRPAYVPALRFHRLTRFYDPLMERWLAAAQIRAAVIEALSISPGLRVLELGCGPGRLAVQVKQANPDAAIDAVDADPAMVAAARNLAQSARADITFYQGDITSVTRGGPLRTRVLDAGLPPPDSGPQGAGAPGGPLGPAPGRPV